MIFYRVHWNDCPEFSPDNAYSALWGRERSADGSQTVCECSGADREDTDWCPDCDDRYDSTGKCGTCDGTGMITVYCRSCGGTGWEDCVRGYSAESSADALIKYFGERGVDDNSGKVIIFEGDRVGTGFDEEPTVIPHRVLETLTWSEFVARTAS